MILKNSAEKCLDGMFNGITYYESGWVHVAGKGKERCRKTGLGERSRVQIETWHDKRERNMECSEQM